MLKFVLFVALALGCHAAPHGNDQSVNLGDENKSHLSRPSPINPDIPSDPKPADKITLIKNDSKFKRETEKDKDEATTSLPGPISLKDQEKQAKTKRESGPLADNKKEDTNSNCNGHEKHNIPKRDVEQKQSEATTSAPKQNEHKEEGKQLKRQASTDKPTIIHNQDQKDAKLPTTVTQNKEEHQPIKRDTKDAKSESSTNQNPLKEHIPLPTAEKKQDNKKDEPKTKRQVEDTTDCKTDNHEQCKHPVGKDQNEKN